MDSPDLLPNNKWIYMCRTREDPKSGLWIFICGGEQKLGDHNRSEISIHQNEPGDSAQQLPPSPEHETLMPTSTKLSAIPTQPSRSEKNDHPEYEPLTPLPTDPATDIITQEVPEPIDAEVKLLMTNMVDIVVQRELQSRISAPAGLNEPVSHSPIILIDTPPTDPELRRLNSRKKKHTEYDPSEPTINSFTCIRCDKTFKTKGALARHKQSSHSEYNYECYECGKTFLRKDTVRKHYKITHPDISLPDHLVMNNTKMGAPPQLVKFNVRSKPTAIPPVSQFSQKNKNETTLLETENTPTSHVDIIKKLMDTLQSFK
jgi:hypothetical protein